MTAFRDRKEGPSSVTDSGFAMPDAAVSKKKQVNLNVVLRGHHK